MISSEDPELEKVAQHLLKHAEDQVAAQYSEVQAIRQRSYYVIALNGLILLAFSRLFESSQLLDLVPVLALFSALLSIGVCVQLWMKKNEWKLYHNVPKELQTFLERRDIPTAGAFFFVLALTTYKRIESHENIIMANRQLLELSLLLALAQIGFWVVAVWFS